MAFRVRSSRIRYFARLRGPSFERTIGDTADAVDSISRTVSYVRDIADSASGSDAIDRVLVLPRTVGESAPEASDAMERIVSFPRTIGETLTAASDLWTIPPWLAVTIHATITESATPGDGWVRAGTFARSLAEASTPIPVFVRSVVTSRTASSGDYDQRPFRMRSSNIRLHDRMRGPSVDAGDVEGTADSWGSVSHLVRPLAESGVAAAIFASQLTRIRSWSEVATPASSFTRVFVTARAFSESNSSSAAWAHHKTSIRAIPESGAAVDDITRSQVLARVIAEALDVVAEFTHLTSHFRTFAITVTTDEVIDRQVGMVRPWAVTVTPASAFGSIADYRRSVAETPGEPSLEWMRGLAHVKTMDAGGADATDTMTVLLVEVTVPPVVDVEASATRLSHKAGHDSLDLAFTFDMLVDRWVVRVGGTGPFDGVLVDEYAGVLVTGGSAELPASSLSVGENEVYVYGRSTTGSWSRR